MVHPGPVAARSTSEFSITVPSSPRDRLVGSMPDGGNKRSLEICRATSGAVLHCRSESMISCSGTHPYICHGITGSQCDGWVQLQVTGSTHHPSEAPSLASPPSAVREPLGLLVRGSCLPYLLIMSAALSPFWIVLPTISNLIYLNRDGRAGRADPGMGDRELHYCYYTPSRLAPCRV